MGTQEETTTLIALVNTIAGMSAPALLVLFIVGFRYGWWYWAEYVKELRERLAKSESRLERLNATLWESVATSRGLADVARAESSRVRGEHRE